MISLTLQTFHSYPQVVKLLIQFNADINQSNAKGVTPLKIAQEKGLTSLLRVKNEEITALDEAKERDQFSDVDCTNDGDNNDVEKSSFKEQISESEEVLMESAQESAVSDHSISPSYSDHDASAEENEMIDVKNDDMPMLVDNDNHSESIEDDVKSPIQTHDIKDEPIQDNMSVESSNELEHLHNDGILS